jgi:thiamine-monophosphate kinase
MAREFELINFLFEPLSKGLAKDEVGIGDDGAVLNVPENHQLVVVTDTLVSGVHFPETTSSYNVAWKSVAVNLSDLAAMGAKPGFYNLALTVPDNNHSWLTGFAKGLSDIGDLYSMPLVGGDTTNGPLTITVTAHGWLPKGKAVLRSGAKEGDVICVTNCIGDGALGLMVAQDNLPEPVKKQILFADCQYLLDALNVPHPQLGLSEELYSFANSAIDISDGLLADVSHILEESNKTAVAENDLLVAVINVDDIPLSKVAQLYIDNTEDWLSLLAGGDDYQLCFTVSPENINLAKKIAKQAGIEISEIGSIVSYDELDKSNVSKSETVNDRVVLLKDGCEFLVDGAKGYMHF